jgi:hypothetical protein
MLDGPVKPANACPAAEPRRHAAAGCAILAAARRCARPSPDAPPTGTMNDATFDAERLARHFVRFATTECAQEPLYDALCRHAAASPEVLAWLQDAAPEQRRPNLLLAALHDLVLEGRAPALAAYYPSAGGERRVDAALAGCFAATCAAHEAALRERIATRTTQTNEIGRCAVLWPVLQRLAHATGASRIALLDVGCSAGLNLGVDAYRYETGAVARGAPAGAGVPTIRCRLVGARAPADDLPAPRIVERLGIDPAPIDVDDARAVRWLRACLWPHDTARRVRFDQAVALARAHRWPVRREADCTAAALDWVRTRPDDVLPVVFNSWVLTYFAPAALARHVARLGNLVQQRGAAWVSAEEPRLRVGGAAEPPLPADADAQARHATLWTVVRRGAEGPDAQVWARSHPHGAWLEWFD